VAGSDVRRLLAISDLHVVYAENRALVEQLRPENEGDWLIVAGDVGEYAADVEWALDLLARRFAKVIWVPGNHELWTPRDDKVLLRGEARYRYLVDLCRRLGVVTPEDPYPVWDGDGDDPVLIAPLFVGYDYSWRPAGTHDKEQAMERAEEAGVICTDEILLHPDPFPHRDDWCRARATLTRRRLDEERNGLPTVLVNHYPLVREPTRILRYPEFALWCGTDLTADWHLRYEARAVVYGHLHIPRTTRHDGVPFEEVSVGYPREWRRRAGPPARLRQILPAGGPQPS
jgi:3',5'-cyclic AMP phosphodiesterase CpdA